MKIFFVIPRKEKYSVLTKSIINKFQQELSSKFIPNIIVTPTKHIIEDILQEISSDDYVVWHPEVAHDNLSLVKNYRNSIVCLKHPTMYNQSISPINPINENMAINHNFKLLYITNDIEHLNTEFKTVLEKKYYTITIEKLNSIIND